MAGYMVYWPQDRVRELQKANDTGPIKVVFGSIHSRMPTIVSIKEGDVVFPVTLVNKKMYAMARLPVEKRERAIDYCLRELGRPCGALEEKGKIYPQFSYNESHTPVYPHLEHQVPFNCCSEWAVWGSNGTSIEPRQLPDECLHDLRFGYPKSREKGLLFDKYGNVAVNSLCSTRRMSQETWEIFENLFDTENQSTEGNE